MVLLVTGAVFCRQAWNLLPLFWDSNARDAAKAAVTAVAGREGWLLSDMLVNEVTPHDVRLTLRRHVRGTDPESCRLIALADFSIRTCE
ncbi:hypothetical protein HYW84_02560 [Candidatus Peregrinibacteria bacterium]|nr:hypothetical protein [Candidatus Peregrinibacteria bacterium]